MIVSKLDWLRNLRGIGRNELSWREYRVLMSVFEYSSGDGTSAHPGAARIAEDTCISERIVRDCLKSLVEKQWLIREERGGQKEGVRRAASFQLHPTPAPYLTPAHSEQAHSEHPARSEPAHSTPTPLPAASSPPGHTHQSSFEGKKEEELLNSVDLETGEISDSDSGAPQQDWWDGQIAGAWNNYQRLGKLGQVMRSEVPGDSRLESMRRRYEELTQPPAPPAEDHPQETPEPAAHDYTPEIWAQLRRRAAERNAA